MALHTNLPIYKVAYDLLDTITDLAKNMPRDFKASIGGKLRDEVVEIVVLIFRANCARDKAPHLGELIERLQVAEFLLRISCDKKLIAMAKSGFVFFNYKSSEVVNMPTESRSRSNSFKKARCSCSRNSIFEMPKLKLLKYVLVAPAT